MRILKALMWFAIWFAATFMVMAIIGLGGYFLFRGLLLIRVIDVNTFLNIIGPPIPERTLPFFIAICFAGGLVIVSCNCYCNMEMVQNPLPKMQKALGTKVSD